MNRPPTASFVVGNWVTLLVVWSLCALFLMQWWQGMLSDVVPVVTVLMMASTANAHRQVVRYKRWKRAWDAMGDAPSRKHPLAFVVGTILWVLTGLVVLCLDRNRPEMMAVTVGFAAVSVLLFVWIVHSDQRGKGGSGARSRKVAAVAICLPIPRHSPGPVQFGADLPQLPGGAQR